MRNVQNIPEEIESLDKHEYKPISGVYFLYDKNVIVYIGESKNILKI